MSWRLRKSQDLWYNIVCAVYYVYAINSLSRTYIYVGISDNVARRVSQHNSGSNKTTRAYRPFELIYSESYPTRAQARLREKYLKSGVGKEFLKSLISK
jgi:putative endonuclease